MSDRSASSGTSAIRDPYAPPDAVFVRGLEFEANHGYTAAERRATRRFRVDVELRRSLGSAARSDRLKDTIDYRGVCQAILRIGTESTFRLLEALAGNIAEAIQELHPDVAVTVELQKLAPPCPGVPQSCGVRLSFEPRS